MVEKLEKLIDFISLQKADLFDKFEDNILAIIQYGSFSYQDLNQNINTFENISSSDGVLDKKPDYILIVSDLESALDKISKEYSWSDSRLKQILSFSRLNPFYFNIETSKKYSITSKNEFNIQNLPYKLGIIDKNGFIESSKFNSSDIYLSSRLSKFFNMIYIDESFRQNFNDSIENIRDFYTRFALSRMNKYFIGYEFLKEYLYVTYLSEYYRIFDIYKNKHLKIYNSSVYDFSSQKFNVMKDVLSDMLKSHVLKYCTSAKIALPLKWSHLKQVKGYDYPSNFQILFYNFYSLINSVHKNRITNSSVNADNFAYILRKL